MLLRLSIPAEEQLLFQEASSQARAEHKPGHFSCAYCAYLEGQGNFITGLKMGIVRVTTWVMGVINPYLLSPPDPPSNGQPVPSKCSPSASSVRQAHASSVWSERWIQES